MSASATFPNFASLAQPAAFQPGVVQPVQQQVAPVQFTPPNIQQQQAQAAVQPVVAKPTKAKPKTAALSASQKRCINMQQCLLGQDKFGMVYSHLLWELTEEEFEKYRAYVVYWRERGVNFVKP